VAEFLAMGGYAGYVWSAFGFTFVVMVGLLAQSWRLARRRERELVELRAQLRPGREPTASRPLVARGASASAELREGA
jgi:heme exporter protein D